MEKPITSEEKLLRLIRKKKSSKQSENSEGNLGGKGPAAKKERSDFLKIINRLLLIAIGGLIGYMGITYLLFPKKEEAAVPSAAAEPVSREVASKALSLIERKPFSFYQETIARRDIFQAPWEKSQEKGAAPLVEDLSKKLKLVGIVLDQKPQAVIEDQETHQTYFLSPGESIGGARLEELQEGKVIFLFNEEKVELTQ